MLRVMLSDVKWFFRRLRKFVKMARRSFICLIRPTYLARLEDLIKHMYIHEGYRKCGYDKMSPREKRLFDKTINSRFMWE